CRIVLGIGCLPQQEIAEAHLASRPDDQVEIRQTRCIQVAVDQIFGNLFCSNARGEHALDGSGDLLATAIVECNVQDQASVALGQLDGCADTFGQAWLNAFECANVPDLDVIAMQLSCLTIDALGKKTHQAQHFV